MKVQPQRYRLSFVLNSIFFPFVEPDFSDLLKEKNYTIGRSVPPVFPHGSRGYMSGRVAIKGDCVVDVDANRKLVASEARSPEEVINSMQELISIAKRNFHVNFKKDLSFIELIANLVVISEGNPLRSFVEFSKRNPALKKFSEVMETDSAFFSIGIIPECGNPTDSKWFDIRISPRHSSFSREYYVESVFRDKEVNPVLDFTKAVNSKIIKLIKVIEGN